MSGDLSPTAIGNQSLDACGVNFTMGDMEEGSDQANVILRAYRQNLQQLLRACHWNFARAQRPLTLLADATGQTANVGTMVQVPWRFAYALPQDCVKMRFVVWNPLTGVQIPVGNITIPTTPQTTGQGQSPLTGARLTPARFLLGTDPNYPSAPGVAYDQVQGTSPAGSTVIMTNVEQAVGVFTANIIWPSLWDPMFRQALVAMIASNVVLRLQSDKKLGMALRREQIAIAKGAINAARVTDGNEAGFANTDHVPDWIRGRYAGGWSGANIYGGLGVLGYGYESVGFADGSGLSASAAF